jgi:hypothetical protein
MRKRHINLQIFPVFMPNSEYPAVDFAEWFMNPGKYRNQSVTLEAALVDWKYTPDRDPLTIVVAACLGMRGSELRLKLRNGSREGEVYYRQDVFWLFSHKRKLRGQQFREILEPLRGQIIRPVVHCMSGGWTGGHYLHLEGLKLESQVLMFNELPIAAYKPAERKLSDRVQDQSNIQNIA